MFSYKVDVLACSFSWKNDLMVWLHPTVPIYAERVMAVWRLKQPPQYFGKTIHPYQPIVIR